MIITRTPLRVSIGGGGTDLASYYSKYGGFWISAAIDKYIYITVNRRTIDNSIWVSYSKVEVVNSIEEIKHDLVRQVLRHHKIKGGVEIHSISEVSSGTGLGSSGAYTVGLLNSLLTFKRRGVSRAALAEEASRIEIDILKEPIGKQDQYIAAFGGLTCFSVSRSGRVRVMPLDVNRHTIEELERNIFLLYTGIKRESSYVLAGQKKAAERDQKKVVDSLHAIKDIGKAIKKALEKGDPDQFGSLLHEHWNVKKRMSNRISNSWIDECYETARKKGALGGKIMGAGGGGFFMFYCREGREKFRKAMKDLGLIEMPFKFDFHGTKVIADFF